MIRNPIGIKGLLHVVLLGPDGETKMDVLVPNLVTSYGDQFYGDRAADIGAQDPVSGMRLGTGSTAVAKTGAGAAIVTYTAGSNVALVGGYPSSAANGGSWRVTYQALWGQGVATANGLAEVVLTNETPLTDSAGVAGDTIARALLNPVVNKGVNDTLTVTWHHDILGS